MSLKLFNTMSRKQEVFKPLDPNNVSLYVCGLTVYNEPHIGNWATYIYWDVLVRTLDANNYKVNHVQNITDVGHLTDDEDQGEDKLQKAAEKERKTAWELADYYIQRAVYGANKLGLKVPTKMPRATEYMDAQIALVKTLEDKGFTYMIEGDGIYFDTSKLDDYGKLARLDIKGLKSGARISSDGKKNVTDFALWKFSPKGATRDMEWDSPWGKGFPGWHVECSTMAQSVLGDTIDIHTGGIDHIPIHHTNEIAQSESATGKPFANYWLHANHIKVNGSKMSKSLGNVYTIKDLEKANYDMRAFRLLVLSSHYRTESNFTWKLMDAAQSRLKRWLAVAALKWQANANHNDAAKVINDSILKAEEVLNDDLDTPRAISHLETAFNYLEDNGIAGSDVKDLEKFIKFIDYRLGIDLSERDISAEAKKLIKQRQAARKSKDYDASDKIRGELDTLGIIVRDTSNGPVWSRK